MTNRYVLIGLLVLQVLCAAFFVQDIVVSVLQLPVPPISWELYELIEIGAALGLILGVVFGALVVRHSARSAARAHDQLRIVSGAFMELLEERFEEWGLTPAEREVALFAIKGLTIPETAGLRNTSEGTVKAQTNAIYRKAGVNGRSQLLSLFIEDLMNGDIAAAAQAAQNSKRTA
ncbi:helix-turn-helix transcriptional regulator [Jhaorihella thermophila]|uniref:Regulatory protein, luxR family n=1 Tax=Jhaorihella thermophila TaxID=488547 RepID=A0A1H5U1V4_9RHOB|nr:helix-turn-helix transcriptional regulator [Jhaorihella thermophila]SEF68231.1 regulatory protein, luxR family [Jhaorihella thermophila]